MAIFSKDGYFKHTPIWVKRVSISLKTLCGIVATSTYFNDQQNWAFGFLILGALIDEAMKFVKEDELPES